jgi:hypothetical protein
MFPKKTAIKMLTIKTEVRKEEKRKDGTFKVRIRITHNRKIKRLSTKLFAKKSDLNKSFELKEGTIIKKEADSLISNFVVPLILCNLYASQHSFS